jgi:hypothetical protein
MKIKMTSATTGRMYATSRCCYGLTMLPVWNTRLDTPLAPNAVAARLRAALEHDLAGTINDDRARCRRLTLGKRGASPTLVMHWQAHESGSRVHVRCRPNVLLAVQWVLMVGMFPVIFCGATRQLVPVSFAIGGALHLMYLLFFFFNTAVDLRFIKRLLHVGLSQVPASAGPPTVTSDAQSQLTRGAEAASS